MGNNEVELNNPNEESFVLLKCCGHKIKSWQDELANNVKNDDLYCQNTVIVQHS